MANKFQTGVTYRLMNQSELEAVATKLGLALDGPTFAFILKEFNGSYLRDHMDEYGGCKIADDHGRICFGQSWEDVYEGLGKSMGFMLDNEDHPKVTKVFKKFFAE